MVETGLNRHDLGKLILAACFITDLRTVPALGGLVATYGWLLIVFVAESAVTVLLLPRLVRFAITRFGHRVSEPEIKLLVVLFGLGGLATQAGSEESCPRKSPGWSWPGVVLARPGSDGPAALHRLRRGDLNRRDARRRSCERIADGNLWMTSCRHGLTRRFPRLIRPIMSALVIELQVPGLHAYGSPVPPRFPW